MPCKSLTVGKTYFIKIKFASVYGKFASSKNSFNLNSCSLCRNHQWTCSVVFQPYLLVCANVASAKKILVHGPDLSSIPSQQPLYEVCSLNILVQGLPRVKAFHALTVTVVVLNRKILIWICWTCICCGCVCVCVDLEGDWEKKEKGKKDTCSIGGFRARMVYLCSCKCMCVRTCLTPSMYLLFMCVGTPSSAMCMCVYV